MPRKMRVQYPGPMYHVFTIRPNNRHPLAGHVLSGRYKAQLVEGSGIALARVLRRACRRR